jgi:hypothetical protein
MSEPGRRDAAAVRQPRMDSALKHELSRIAMWRQFTVRCATESESITVSSSRRPFGPIVTETRAHDRDPKSAISKSCARLPEVGESVDRLSLAVEAEPDALGPRRFARREAGRPRRTPDRCSRRRGSGMPARSFPAALPSSRSMRIRDPAPPRDSEMTLPVTRLMARFIARMHYGRPSKRSEISRARPARADKRSCGTVGRGVMVD